MPLKLKSLQRTGSQSLEGKRKIFVKLSYKKSLSEREKMDESEHGNYVQFFDWKTVDGDETNLYARLGKSQ